MVKGSTASQNRSSFSDSVFEHKSLWCTFHIQIIKDNHNFYWTKCPFILKGLVAEPAMKIINQIRDISGIEEVVAHLTISVHFQVDGKASSSGRGHFIKEADAAGV